MWSIFPSFFAWSLLERDSLPAQRFVPVSRDAGQQPGYIDKAGRGHFSRLPIVGRARSGWQGAGRRCGAATPSDAGGVCALHGVRSATKSVPCAERSRASLRRAHSQRIKGQRRRVWQRLLCPGPMLPIGDASGALPMCTCCIPFAQVFFGCVLDCARSVALVFVSVLIASRMVRTRFDLMHADGVTGKPLSERRPREGASDQASARTHTHTHAHTPLANLHTQARALAAYRASTALGVGGRACMPTPGQPGARQEHTHIHTQRHLRRETCILSQTHTCAHSDFTRACTRARVRIYIYAHLFIFIHQHTRERKRG